MMKTLAPSEVVQLQLEAYNRRDLAAFLALFADDACGFELGSPAPTLNGKSEIGERYRQLFDSSPHLHSVLVSRTAFGRAVVDHERISGRMGSPEVLELMVIYEVVERKIQRFHVVRT